MTRRKTPDPTPEELSELARIARDHEAELWTEIDRLALRQTTSASLVTMAAEAFARRAVAYQLLERDGLVVRNAQGLTAHPAVAIVATTGTEYQALLGRLRVSITPSQARYAVNRAIPVPFDGPGSVLELVNRPPTRMRRDATGHSYLVDED